MKNAEFYTRAPLDQPVKKKRKRVIKWKQVLTIAALVIFFAPLSPSRRTPLHTDFPTDWFNYLEKSGFTALLVCAILFILFIYERTQFASAVFHFKLVGTFEVKEKVLKPKKRIRMHPGGDHLLSVDNTLFHQLAIGDKVYVERRMTGEIISMRKVL